MHAAAKLHHPTVSIDGPTPSHLVVSVTGDEGDRLRPTLGLVFVIDQSGSMAWQSKLTTVTSSLRYLSTYLTDDDEIALVSFATNARVELAATKATADGISTFNAALGKLRASGGTDLDHGLKVGIALANQLVREKTNRVVRVIVLTDGDATNGQTNPTMIVKRMDSAADGVSLSTIGVGSDCNHDLLGRLAERGSGSYGFVESPGQAAEVLGAEVGGLINLDASDVKVTVEARATYLSVSPALAVPCSTDSDGRLVVSLGNLVAGQTRTLVFPVSALPPKGAFVRPVTGADVIVTGRVEDMATTIECKPKVKFADGVTVRDESLDEDVDLAVLAVAQRAAEERATHHDYAGASSLLRSAGSQCYTAGVAVLGSSLGASYSSAEQYRGDQGLRNSASSLLNATTDLIGSSPAFNSLVSRTIGGYGTDAQREVGLNTAKSVAGEALSSGGEASCSTEGFSGSINTGGSAAAICEAGNGASSPMIQAGSAAGAWYESVNIAGGTGVSTTQGSTDSLNVSTSELLHPGEMTTPTKVAHEKKAVKKAAKRTTKSASKKSD
jgi:uncharacterized protein YegL